MAPGYRVTGGAGLRCGRGLPACRPAGGPYGEFPKALRGIFPALGIRETTFSKMTINSIMPVERPTRVVSLASPRYCVTEGLPRTPLPLPLTVGERTGEFYKGFVSFQAILEGTFPKMDICC